MTSWGGRGKYHVRYGMGEELLQQALHPQSHCFWQVMLAPCDCDNVLGGVCKHAQTCQKLCWPKSLATKSVSCMCGRCSACLMRLSTISLAWTSMVMRAERVRRCKGARLPLTMRVRAPSWAVHVSKYWARAAGGLGAAKHCSTPEHQYTCNMCCFHRVQMWRSFATMTACDVQVAK